MSAVNPTSSSLSIVDGMPSHSPATSLPNLVYRWRGHNVRYQAAGPADASRTVLLVHGLFVNSDHWHRTLVGLRDTGDVQVYAPDLLGSGWSL